MNNDRHFRELKEAAPKFVYVMMPSAGIITPGTKHVLRRQVYEVLGQLHDECPQHTFMSPSFPNYLLLPYMRNPDAVTYEHWKARCELIMPRFDCGLLLPFHGWETSSGVRGEREFMDEADKTVYWDRVRSEYFEAPDPSDAP